MATARFRARLRQVGGFMTRDLLDRAKRSRGYSLYMHLVQSVCHVDPMFFFEVERSQTTPFSSHLSLASSPWGDSDEEDDVTSEGLRYGQSRE